MMSKAAKEFAKEHLSSLKERLRILHETEDEYLIRILSSSLTAVAKLVGASAYDESLLELSLERSVFVYNDALDEFKSLYHTEIEDLYLTNLIKASEGEKDETR